MGKSGEAEKAPRRIYISIRHVGALRISAMLARCGEGHRLYCRAMRQYPAEIPVVVFHERVPGRGRVVSPGDAARILSSVYHG